MAIGPALAQALPGVDALTEHTWLLLSNWVIAAIGLVIIYLGWRMQGLLLRNMETLERQRQLLIDLGRRIGEETLLERLARDDREEVREFLRALREAGDAQRSVLSTLEEESGRVQRRVF